MPDARPPSSELLTLEQALHSYGPYFNGSEPASNDEVFARLEAFGSAYWRVARHTEREFLRQLWIEWFKRKAMPDVGEAWRVVDAAIRGAGDGTTPQQLGRPLGVRELLRLPEPDDRFIVDGLLAADSNALVAGYPKTHKTNFVLALALSAAAGQPFLGRFAVPRPHRVGLVLMEDRAHRIRRRLQRLCAGLGIALEDLDERLHLWFRPPLRLTDAGVMGELAGYVEDSGVELLAVDSWAYVATGDSNSADDVTPQLVALSALRTERRGLAVMLVHHARKAGPDRTGERLTDAIRNSSAFGAWYDVGLLLLRADETGPVTVRSEHRDLPSPPPFAFTVEDEIAAGPDTGPQASGWLRLSAASGPAALVTLEADVAKLMPVVEEALRREPGCSRRALRKAVPGRNDLVDRAFDALCREQRARYEEPGAPGKAGRCYLEKGTVPDRAPTAPGHGGEDRARPCPAPVGGGPGAVRGGGTPVVAGHGLAPDAGDAWEPPA